MVLWLLNYCGIVHYPYVQPGDKLQERLDMLTPSVFTWCYFYSGLGFILLISTGPFEAAFAGGNFLVLFALIGSHLVVSGIICIGCTGIIIWLFLR